MNIIGNMYPIDENEIKRYLNQILDDFTDEQFTDFADNEFSYTDKIVIKPSFTTKEALYEKEGSMNGYEERVVNEMGNMSNIAFWTRNIQRKGFRIN